MQRFLAGFMLAFALVGYAGWAWESHRSTRALAAAAEACDVRVYNAVALAREGYVLPEPAPEPTLPVPVDAPSEPIRPRRRAPVSPRKPLPPAPQPETAIPGPPPGGADSPDNAAPGGGLGYGETSPWRVTRLDQVELPAPLGCQTTGTCDVDVRAGMVRARATCGGADVPCTVTGDERAPTIVPPVSVTLPPRWSAELRAGYGSDGWAAGASVYGRSRWGGWVHATDRAGSGGVAIRLGR